MRFVSVVIFAVVMWGFQFGMDQSIYGAIKKEALIKINNGLGSLSSFSAKLTLK